MKRLIFVTISIGFLLTPASATEVVACTTLRGYAYGVYPINCGDGKTTLKAMYKKGWRYVGSAMSGSGGGVVILEK